ncbi:glycosyltransferase family 2 protein [Dactylosporangium sp. NPDC000244]|uniref:glycosyltransferase family 2 protein n=1 Tax=Dactylosporangium sp. NPDC000244 TaxID=3154365 RepID=UPI00331D77BA
MSTTAEHTTTLSVVVPMYNEEAVIPIMAERLRKVLDGLDVSYEVVAVDDGSTDATAAVLVGLRRYWPQLRVIRLRRNGGHQAALTAGLHRSVGDYVVSIDADLQDPPELIKDMLDMARSQNLDIVYGVRNDRSTDTMFKRWTAVGYYRMMRGIAGNRMPHNAGDFRLLSRVTVDALRALPEQQPVYRLLVPWLGFPSGTVEYSRERRAVGVTKYPLTKMVRLAADSVTSFSAAPLRIATWLGLAGFAVCIGLVVWVLVAYFAGVTVPGWASLSVVLLFLGAVQLLCLGLLGEYVGRIFAASQGRPMFFIAYDSSEEVVVPAFEDDPVSAGQSR